MSNIQEIVSQLGDVIIKACVSVPNYTQRYSYSGSAKSVFFGKIAFFWKIQVQNNADRRETCFDLSIEASAFSA